MPTGLSELEAVAVLRGMFLLLARQHGAKRAGELVRIAIEGVKGDLASIPISYRSDPDSGGRLFVAATRGETYEATNP
mgnify:CR=1 FL=1